MTHEEIVKLIQNGVNKSDGIWADFGAGNGNFTVALRQLLGETATIYAVDKDKHALKQLQQRVTPPINIIHADFTDTLELPPLDGLLMANALHWISKQDQIMAKLSAYLKLNAPFIMVEYDVSTPRIYIPRPVSYKRFEALAQSAQLQDIAQIGKRESARTGVSMYAGIGIKI